LPAKMYHQEEGRAYSPIDARLILNIRWVAIFGQMAVLLYTYFVIQLAIPIGQALFIIGLAVAMNVWQTRRTVITRHKDDQNFLALCFDVVQLALLLFFTGGLVNPFAILFLAPVFVAGTILRRQEILFLTVLVVACVSILAVYNYPLPWQSAPLQQQSLYFLGLWLALCLSAIFIGFYAWRVASSARRLAEALARTQMEVAEEQQATALGALATSAAHKLGSPLNTIMVITHELEREIHADDPIREDIRLLRSEAERCRLILRELDDYKLVTNIDVDSEISLATLLREILDERIEKSEIAFLIRFETGDAGRKTMVRRRPEIIQALDDIFHNAENFAKSRVVVTVSETAQNLMIAVSDDGSGFSEEVLSRAGEPWNSTRNDGGEHRGLGIFIAQTLIEAVGGSILFSNSASGGGEVRIILPVSVMSGAGDK